MPRAFELAASRPWLMLPDALDTLMAIADRQGDPEALEARLGKPLDNTRAVSLRDGVAVIPVTGPIMRYANLFTRISGATSTQELATDLQAALDDPKVRAIVLNVDSPGGEATGINELADMIHAARGRKPIKAYVGGTGASAAYWIASAADEVVVDDTALLGSIGVVVEVAIRKEADGIKRYTITSSNAPNKRPDLDTEQGRAEVAKSIDALAEVFVAKVARNLAVDPEGVPVMGDFGGLKVGAAAVDAGLAHRLGSLESLLTELASPAATQRKPSMTIVSTTAELQAAIAAGTDPQIIQIAAERERITGIHALAAAGFDEEIAAAIDSGASVEATALTLFKAAQDRGISIAAIKRDATAAAPATPPTAGAASTANTAAAWSRTMKKIGG
ncbi:S49 family peptidase [Azotobacter chroococcum]|uniref:S49 family peptidase n=1 Tax=Azotobacter chroococcum TaxID=353 RepID=UPI0010AE4727|nr:S49 family peptidase [Azotobacter chroococcum]TKD46083.1 S49 family peptidase [Azotobacter chroococcum]